KHPRKVVRRTPATRKSLKYPGRDRTKTGPTPARPKRSKRTRPAIVTKVVNTDQWWTPGAQRRTVSGDAAARGRCGTETGSTSGSQQGDRRRLSRVAHS